MTIAAQACLLLLHRDTEFYPKLTTVLVYPSAYVAKAIKPVGSGLALEGENVNLGESWTNGIVVLSWDDVRAGASDFQDGRNLVLHEFAHQLDREDGAVDGAPLLDQRSQYVAWARVLNAEFERLKRDSWMGRPTVLDEYGTTDPAEFFAVATECFFEKPRVLEKRHPELYAELRSFYRQDPARLLPADQRRAREHSASVTRPSATERTPRPLQLNSRSREDDRANRRSDPSRRVREPCPPPQGTSVVQGAGSHHLA